MDEFSKYLVDARSKWKFTGKSRPDFAITPKSGQESVWDYPRPPAIDHDERLVIVKFNEEIIAESTRSIRILETSSPPGFYIPREDINFDFITEGTGSSVCEWKGEAVYWSLKIEENQFHNVGWSYPDPFSGFELIRSFLSFYPSKLECYVDSEKVRPQPGIFYGGWITSEIVGPFKGEPGTGWW